MSVGSTPDRGAEALNITLVLATSLAPHTIVLIASTLFAAILLLRPNTNLVPRALLSLGHTAASALTAALDRKRPDPATTHQSLAPLTTGRRGTARAAIASNLGGLAFITAITLAVTVSTATRERYDYFWETSLLTNNQVQSLLATMTTPLDALGIPTPTAEDIRAAGDEQRATIDTDDTARAWSIFLIASLTAWGIAPRLILLIAATLTTAAADHRAKRQALDELNQRILDRAAAIARENADTDARNRRTTAHQDESADPANDDRPIAEPAVVWIDLAENERQRIRETLTATGINARDAGAIERHADAARIIKQLQDAPTRPAFLLIASTLGETPTASTVTTIKRLTRAAAAPPAAALSLGRSMTLGDPGTADRIKARLNLWRNAIADAGGNPAHAAEIGSGESDPDAPTRLKAALADLITSAPSDQPAPALPTPEANAEAAEHAAHLIAAAIENNSITDDTAAARLFADIDRRFNAQANPTLISELKHAIHESDPDSFIRVAKHHSSQLAQILPAWAPRRPKWMAAGAAAASLTAIGAAAVAFGPAGIVAAGPLWPLYSAAGAAIGESMGRAAHRADSPPSPTDVELQDAGVRVRAAVLRVGQHLTRAHNRADAAAVIEHALDDAGEPDDTAGAHELSTWAKTTCAHLARRACAEGVQGA